MNIAYRAVTESLLARGTEVRLVGRYGPDAVLSIADGFVNAALAGKTAGLLGPVDLPQELCFTPGAGPVIADLLEKDVAFGTAYNFAGAGTEDIVRRGYSPHRCGLCNEASSFVRKTRPGPTSQPRGFGCRTTPAISTVTARGFISRD